jgi:TonB family protein
MKRCPTCNRTYTDESLIYCLADGAFLSAPNDPQLTVASPKLRSTEATEIIQTEQLPGHIVTEPPPVIVPSTRKQNLLPWLITGMLAIAFIVYLALPKGSTPNNSNSLSASSSNQVITTNVSSSVSPTPIPTYSTPATQGGLESNKRNNTIDTDTINANKSEAGRIEPSRQSNNKAGINKEVAAEDYNTTFNPKDVSVQARILSKPEAQYTEEARKNQVSGTVVLRAVFSSSGQVTNIRAVSGLPYGLTERAIAAAREIRFSPAMKDGHAVSQYIQIEYNFNLY